MRRLYLFIISILFLSPFIVKGEETETLNYVVSYKWGLIHQAAGDAIITRTPHKDGYELKLIGITRPWADRIYKMRDTLISNVSREHYMPSKYTRIAHEKNKYSRDEIIFEIQGETTKGTGYKYREKKDGTVTRKDVNIEGNFPAYDILSVFYFLRDIDFNNLKENETIHATIFSGDQSEKLTVQCKGKEKIKLKDKTERETWHITFKFTTKGGTKSSDDIDCWISEDSSHIPLLIVGSLPVGQIRCTYVP